MSAAMVSVKVAMASCIELTVVPKSATTVVIETFMTVPSITMTNWAIPSTISGNHLRTPQAYSLEGGGVGLTRVRGVLLRFAPFLV